MEVLDRVRLLDEQAKQLKEQTKNLKTTRSKERGAEIGDNNVLVYLICVSDDMLNPHEKE